MMGLRAVMAELGIWVTNARGFCGVGIKDPKGKQWHTYVQARKIAQGKEKRVRIRSGENKIKQKSRSLAPKKGPTMGLEPTWV
jgi:hypothetical protein